MEMRVIDPETVPWWLMPECLSTHFEKDDIASKNFECPICYFELHRGPVCILRFHSRRSCEHYIHIDCAQQLLAKEKQAGNEASCVSCGSKFNEVKLLPDINSDPRGFFQLADLDQGGSLSKEEVFQSLGVVLPIGRKKLQEAIRNHWFEWDPDNSGSITMKEFLAKDVGLKDFIIRLLKEAQKMRQTSQGLLDLKEIPSLETHPDQWFRHWDVDNSGTLELEEIVRAFMRNFCVSAKGEPLYTRAFEIRLLAQVTWEELGFHPLDSIDFETFMEPGGFADTFTHNSVFCGEGFGDGGGTF